MEFGSWNDHFSLCAFDRRLGIVFRTLVLICLALVAASTARAEPFETSAPVALLLDASSGMLLLGRNVDRPVEPAAMAKMMTVAVVAEALAKGETSLDTEYPVSEQAWRKGGAPSRSATMFAALKSRIRVADLLRGAMVQAANDACLIMAEGIAGSEDAFVVRMNALAAAIGMTHTHFSNVTGFADPDQHTTARDLAVLVQYLVDHHPQIYAVYGEKEFTWNRIRQLNRNPLLTAVAGTDGGATGASDSAGFGLAASAMRDGRRLVLVVHGLKSVKERADEAARILEWGFKSFEPKEMFAAGETIGEASVFGGTSWTVPLVADGPVRLPVRTDSKDQLQARIVYDGPLPAPVRRGDAVGRLQVLREGIVALEIPVRAGADVPVGGLGKRALDALYEFGVGLVRGRAERS